ncbi:hypothetical protein NUSPORA_00651 [Nucleospora cyclopteri]
MDFQNKKYNRDVIYLTLIFILLTCNLVLVFSVCSGKRKIEPASILHDEQQTPKPEQTPKTMVEKGIQSQFFITEELSDLSSILQNSESENDTNVPTDIKLRRRNLIKYNLEYEDSFIEEGGDGEHEVFIASDSTVVEIIKENMPSSIDPIEEINYLPDLRLEGEPEIRSADTIIEEQPQRPEEIDVSTRSAQVQTTFATLEDEDTESDASTIAPSIGTEGVDIGTSPIVWLSTPRRSGVKKPIRIVNPDLTSNVPLVLTNTEEPKEAIDLVTLPEKTKYNLRRRRTTTHTLGSVLREKPKRRLSLQVLTQGIMPSFNFSDLQTDQPEIDEELPQTPSPRPRPSSIRYGALLETPRKTASSVKRTGVKGKINILNLESQASPTFNIQRQDEEDEDDDDEDDDEDDEDEDEDDDDDQIVNERMQRNILPLQQNQVIIPKSILKKRTGVSLRDEINEANGRSPLPTVTPLMGPQIMEVSSLQDSECDRKIIEKPTHKKKFRLIFDSSTPRQSTVLKKRADDFVFKSNSRMVSFGQKSGTQVKSDISGVFLNSPEEVTARRNLISALGSPEDPNYIGNVTQNQNEGIEPDQITGDTSLIESREDDSAMQTPSCDLNAFNLKLLKQNDSLNEKVLSLQLQLNIQLKQNLDFQDNIIELERLHEEALQKLPSKNKEYVNELVEKNKKLSDDNKLSEFELQKSVKIIQTYRTAAHQIYEIFLDLIEADWNIPESADEEKKDEDDVGTNRKDNLIAQLKRILENSDSVASSILREPMYE